MKWLVAAFGLSLSVFSLSAQSDSLVSAVQSSRLDFCVQSDSPFISKPTFVSRMDRITSSRAYRMTYVGVPLVVGGLIIQSEDNHFRSLRQSYAPSFNQHYDDYLQYSPAVLMLGLKTCGVKSRSSWGRMLVSDVFSVAIVSMVVNSLKSTVRVTRPDGSSRNSFPSGHTATAFMAATMLHKEYGWRSPWYSIAGYSAATVTGLSRMLNNRHWLSDVMTGAGIGIVATELGYYFSDLIFKDRGITEFTFNEHFDRTWCPSFLGFYFSFDSMQGHYTLASDVTMNCLTGSTVGVEGAYFFSPYIGIGGRFGVGSFPFMLNNQPQQEPLKSVSGFAGAYFSFPITARWMIGSKALFGYYYNKSATNLLVAGATEFFEVGSTGDFSFGTGLSLMFRAKQNMAVRFFCDYTLASSVMSQSRDRLHVITTGCSMNIVFLRGAKVK